MALAAMVILLTVWSLAGSQYSINDALYVSLQLLIVVGSVYWALRGL